mmetsp:Transcript_12502/g.32900  ORF Transcript_12502/g.32900 Transcript_12502/m.32900 type:complete len:233 (-) Transcript_12502:1192-1890(-)
MSQSPSNSRGPSTTEHISLPSLGSSGRSRNFARIVTAALRTSAVRSRKRSTRPWTSCSSKAFLPLAWASAGRAFNNALLTLQLSDTGFAAHKLATRSAASSFRNGTTSARALKVASATSTCSSENSRASTVRKIVSWAVCGAPFTGARAPNNRAKAPAAANRTLNSTRLSAPPHVDAMTPSDAAKCFGRSFATATQLWNAAARTSTSPSSSRLAKASSNPGATDSASACAER